ncbi:MAG: hypothetical protein ACRC1H_15935 [Caldilineaceae bacterium]
MATAPVSRRLNLTRDQLAAFLTDQQQIRQFELLFSTLDAIAIQNVSANLVYAGPTGGAASTPSFRALVPSDIPAQALTKTDDTNVTLTLGGTPASALLAAVSLTLGWTGQLSVARGGTGQSSFTDGQLLIGNSTDNTLTKATLTQGPGINITNAAGAITIGTAGGISGTAALAKLTVAGTNGSLTFTDGIITGYVAPT